MKPFQEFTIHHQQLSQISEFSPLSANNFIVFWWNQIPLGHLWLRGEPSFSQSRFREKVVSAIAPAMTYYGGSAGVDPQSWQAYLLDGDVASLSPVLNSCVQLPPVLKQDGGVLQAVSVVICTRNRSEALKGCIEALLNSSDQDFELIVVDNAPDSDSTRDLVALFPSVRYIREEKKGLDIARNTGALNAAHNIVAYTDDDVLVSKDWIKTVKLCFKDPSTSCITGQVFPVQLATEAQYIFEHYWGFNKGYVPLLYDAQYFAGHLKKGVPVWEIGAGANMAFRKEVFSQAGLFDERLDVGAAGCSGDSEFWYRILAAGGTCRYHPHLYVYHNHRETKRELEKQLYNYMRGNIAALLVQYEKFGHRGNLARMYKAIPKWYLGRFKNALLGREQDGFLFTEIKGYFSGWRFYQSHKKGQKVPVDEQHVMPPC